MAEDLSSSPPSEVRAEERAFYHRLSVSVTRELAALRRAGSVSRSYHRGIIEGALDRQMKREEPVIARKASRSSSSSSLYDKDSEELCREESYRESLEYALQRLADDRHSRKLPKNSPTTSVASCSAEYSEDEESSFRQSRASSTSSKASSVAAATVAPATGIEAARNALQQLLPGLSEAGAAVHREREQLQETTRQQPDLEYLRAQRRVNSLRDDSTFINRLAAIWGAAPSRLESLGSRPVRQRPFFETIQENARERFGCFFS